MVTLKLDAIPSGTFSSVMDSLTEITGELKDVRGKLEAGSRTSVAQPSGKNINTNSSNVKPLVPTRCRMSDEEWSWRMDRGEKREETASADDRRYSIVGGQPKSRLPLLLSPSRSHGTSLLDGSTPPLPRMTSRGIWKMLRSSTSMYARSRKWRNGKRNMLHSVLQSTLKRKTEFSRSPFGLMV